ncbi:mitoferrin-2 isoform X1 [Peromyscus maniculatus bairdii]|uniref:mitoferrin-2 isoform X1 n=1 Tax=Peromyscus maniculatus bairdii TaxID=230844 RepID=UPI003FD16E60
MELEGRSAGGVAGGPAAGPGRSPGESALLDGWLQRGVGRGAGGGEAGACQPPVRQDPDSGPEYEALPAGATVTTHMVAGAVAGILEHCVMYPVDCVKTRMQSLQPDPAARYRNVLEALWRIIRTEGLWRPMRGLNVTATGAGPAHALYFACYEKLKKTLSDVIHPGGNSHIANGIEPSCAGPPLPQLSGLCCCQCFPVSAWFGAAALGWGAAGCVATLLHDAAMNPAEVVKQRMQMYNSPYHRVTDCVRAVWQNEGAGAFYRSYTTQLTMNVPFQAIHFMTYEFLQEHFNPQRRYNPSSHMLSGACAGAVAAAATTPLDVCKTLLNTQEPLALNSNITGHITGMASAFRTVYQVGGLTAYFRGVQARVIYQIPSTAIAWSVYEFFKYLITKRQDEWRAAK